MCEEEVPIINNGKSDENIIAIIYLILKLVLYNLLTPFASTRIDPTFNLTRNVLDIPFLPFSKKSIILE